MTSSRSFGAWFRCSAAGRGGAHRRAARANGGHGRAQRRRSASAPRETRLTRSTRPTARRWWGIPCAVVRWAPKLIALSRLTACWRRVLLALIRAYQITLSRLIVALMGPVCRFEPSCSRYAAACIVGHGALRGSLLSLKRLCRCHPFHPGGFDLRLHPSSWPQPRQPDAAATRTLTCGIRHAVRLLARSSPRTPHPLVERASAAGSPPRTPIPLGHRQGPCSTAHDTSRSQSPHGATLGSLARPRETPAAKGAAPDPRDRRRTSWNAAISPNGCSSAWPSSCSSCSAGH